MKLLLVLAASVLSLELAAGSELTDRIRAEAQECADALISGDFAKALARTHRHVIAEMGGMERAVAQVASTMEEARKEGIEFVSVTISLPQEPVAKGPMVAVVVPQTTIFKTPKGRYRQEGHLLAISEDGGTRWSFIDTGSLDAATLATYFPTMAGVIKLPPKKEPVPLGD